MYHGLPMSKHRDGIEREPWATGRVSTSEADWLGDHQGKDFTMPETLWTRLSRRLSTWVNKIATSDIIVSLRIF